MARLGTNSGRMGPAAFPNNAGLRAGGSAQTGTTTGSISDAGESSGAAPREQSNRGL